MKSAIEAIILEADEIVVKPVEVKQLAELVRERLLIQRPITQPPKESVSAILRRCSEIVVNNWLARANQSRELNHLELKDEERTGHLPKLIQDLVRRLNGPSRVRRGNSMQPSPLPPSYMASYDTGKATPPRCWCMNPESFR